MLETAVAMGVSVLIPQTTLIDEAIELHGAALTWTYNALVHYVTFTYLIAFTAVKFNYACTVDLWFTPRKFTISAVIRRAANTYQAMFFFFIYMSHFNIHVVYKTNISKGVAAIGMSMVVIIVNSIYISAQGFLYATKQSWLGTRWWWFQRTTYDWRLKHASAFATDEIVAVGDMKSSTGRQKALEEVEKMTKSNTSTTLLIFHKICIAAAISYRFILGIIVMSVLCGEDFDISGEGWSVLVYVWAIIAIVHSRSTEAVGEVHEFGIVWLTTSLFLSIVAEAMIIGTRGDFLVKGKYFLMVALNSCVADILTVLPYAVKLLQKKPSKNE